MLENEEKYVDLKVKYTNIYLGIIFDGLSGTTVDLFLDFLEFAGNVSGVTVQDGTVSVRDLSRMVQHDDLGREVGGPFGWVALGVSSNVSSSDFLDGNVLNVETNIVSGSGFGQSFVVHLHRLDFSGQTNGGESDHHSGLDDSSLNSADGHSSDTTNFVDILERKTKGLIGRSRNTRDKPLMHNKPR